MPISSYAGVFFTSFAVLFFEILCARVFSVLVDSSWICFITGFSLMGVGLAGAAAGLLADRPAKRPASVTLPVFCVFMAAAAAGVFALATFLCHTLNARLDILLAAGDIEAARAFIAEAKPRLTLLLGAAALLPVGAGSFAVITAFAGASRENYGKLYCADLLGGAAGCAACAFALEYGGFRAPLAAAVGLPLLAAFFFTRGGPRLARGLLAASLAATCLLLSAPSSSRFFEPRPHLNILAAAFVRGDEVSEDWRGWNSYARVAALTVRNARENSSRRLLAHGSGQGGVQIRMYPSGKGATPDAGPWMAPLLDAPGRALALFAGVGNEAVSLDRACAGAADITVVEINRKMLGWALGQPELGLAAFFSRPNIHLKIAEARTFLEKDKSKYDLILLPYAGASYGAYFSGGGNLARFMFTREAMRTIAGHLTVNGLAVIAGENKVTLLATLRGLLEETSRDRNLSRSVVIAQSVAAPPGRRPTGQARGRDSATLLFKPSGFSAGELRAVRARAAKRGLEIYYAPDAPAAPTPYTEVLRGSPGQELGRLERSQDPSFNFRVKTDDNPFFLKIPFTLNGRISSPVNLILLLAAMAAGLMAAGLWTQRAPAGSAEPGLLGFFFLTGCGTAFIEIGFAQKFSLLLGNPVYSLSVTMGSFLLFSGLGSFYISPDGKQSRSGLGAAALLAGCAVAAQCLFIEGLKPFIFQLPFAAKLAATISLLGPGAFILGQLFPRGLVLARRSSARLASWGWAINGAAAAAGSVLAAALAPYIGLMLLIFIGGTCCLAAALSALAAKAAPPVPGTEQAACS